MNGFYPVLNEAEMAYLRHKAWHINPWWYWYPRAREMPRDDLFGGCDYLFMGGMEVEKVNAILRAYRRLDPP